MAFMRKNISVYQPHRDIAGTSAGNTGYLVWINGMQLGKGVSKQDIRNIF